jgi:hypothetical protein
MLFQKPLPQGTSMASAMTVRPCSAETKALPGHANEVRKNQVAGLLDSRTTANEADAGNQALDDLGLRLERVRRDALRCLNEPAACNSDKRKGSQAGTSFIALTILPDGKGKHIGQGRGMRDHPKRLKQVFSPVYSISTSRSSRKVSI